MANNTKLNMGKLGLLVVVFLLLILMAGCKVDRISPSARHGAKMIYDPVGKQVLMFGGRVDGEIVGDLKNDLWSLDMETHRWQEIETSSGPSPRLSPGLVYDPSHHQVIVFGGYRTQGRENDTWLLDLENYEWEELSPTQSPPARSDMGMAYDGSNQIAVLFGGYCLEQQRDKCDDTWVFDPDTNSWIEKSPLSSPPIIYGHSLDYDSQMGQFLLWGGHMSSISDGNFSSAGYNDSIWSYSYSENEWQEFSPGYDTHPQKRYWHQASYVSAHPGLLVVGGDTGYGYKNDSWFYDSLTQSWDRLKTTQAPPARIVGTMVYCPDYGQVVLFGGLDNDFNNLNDTWIYTDVSGEWEQISY